MINKSKSEIVIFTDKYPYGSGETFFEAELEFIAAAFGKVYLIPLESLGGKTHRHIPENVILFAPPFLKVKDKKELMIKGIANKSDILFFVIEFFRSAVFLSKHKFRNWVTHFLLTRAMLAYFNKLSGTLDFDRIGLLYFYWGLRWSQILPFISTGNNIKVVRFHGSDLYEERNHNYIPFRKEQLQKIDLSVFVSEMGRNYLTSSYPDILKKPIVSRLGTEDFGIEVYSHDNKVRIISCSNLIPLKQISIIAKSLKYFKRKCQWIHVGDGPLRHEIESIISGYDFNIVLTGQLDRKELFSIYQNHVFDVFINTSLSEGVPVSVMEALSFGIPVIATDVGGTAEIVDKEVGMLISSDISPEELAIKVEELISRADYNQVRQNARKRWEERCQGKQLYTEFVEILRSL